MESESVLKAAEEAINRKLMQGQVLRKTLVKTGFWIINNLNVIN